MAKMIIVEGNSNDKDNLRVYMVKGEKGYSAYDIYVQNGGTLPEDEWINAFLNADNFYNKTETDTLLEDKADASDVYEKTDVYNKTETDNLLDDLVNDSYSESTIETYSANYINSNFTTKGTTLWTNPNPLSGFDAQNITLSSDDYDYLEVYYYGYLGNQTTQSMKVPKGVDFETPTIFSHVSAMHWGSRAFAYTSDTEIAVRIAYGCNSTNPSVATAVNDWLVPIKIIGYK